ncbi:MAG: NADP-dependent malic enzyme [Planctomycetes bacterium]|nr:NADP-dependent malic enzyme [Planctomycetota bacterium]
MAKIRPALDYHREGRPGKIEVVPTKPLLTQRDLSLAYTPGVAEPCLEIQQNPDDAYLYTAKGNLVAVLSNGTAVLGLGDIGALAGKPVMEGKATLFKKFADIDVFDIEVAATDPDEVIRVVRALEPTFGGINLEDIKAPDCFHIEEACRETMNIPVFHDDQHGTAIIAGAALLNALEVVKKEISKVRVVFSGAGAAGIACANHFVSLGVRLENVMMCDTKGVIHADRQDPLNKYKARFAQKTRCRTLADALKGADVFLGVSVKGLLTPDMIRSMARDPVVFAMANPDPEITYPEAIAARKDVIMATGRSDYPNQVNNVLGFPFIFRGALDVRATKVTEGMKRAATKALAELAKEGVPDQVSRAYGGKTFTFGREYLIPKPFDQRVLFHVAPAVAQAAMEDGVAKKPIADLDAYREALRDRIDPSYRIMRRTMVHARERCPQIVFAEGHNDTIIRASQAAREEGICRPILLGDPDFIKARAASMEVDLGDTALVHPRRSARLDAYSQALWEIRRRKGLTRVQARAFLESDHFTYGITMVLCRDADGFCGGITVPPRHIIRRAIQIIGVDKAHTIVSGVHMMIFGRRLLFFADTIINADPNPDQLAEIAIGAAEVARRFEVEPRVAFLSYSNFGSVRSAHSGKMARAVEITRRRAPDLLVDGEMNVAVALSPALADRDFSFSPVAGRANVLIFPDLAAGHIARTMAVELGGAQPVGPVLMGLNCPVALIMEGAAVEDIVRMTTLTVFKREILEDIERQATKRMAAGR